MDRYYTTTKDLKWNSHITNITAKTNRTLGFIQRNLKTTNKLLKQAAYRVLVRPKLEYASTVWDPYTQDSINSIEIKSIVEQPGGSRTNTMYRQTSRVELMLSDLKWQSLQSRRKQARLRTFYKYHHDLTNKNSKYALCHKNTNRTSSHLTITSANKITSHPTEYRQQRLFPHSQSLCGMFYQRIL